MHYFVIAL